MRIDLSMQETGVSAIGPAILEAQRSISRPRLGCAHIWKAPHNVFPCYGEDRWIAIAVSTDAEWLGLRKAMAEPSWAIESRFDTAPGRWAHRHDLDERLGQWTSTQDAQDLMVHLQQHGVAAGAVLTAEELVSNPHLQERRYLQEFRNEPAPLIGSRVYTGRPFQIPQIPVEIRRVAALGEDNAHVLRELAGLSDGEIQTLAEEGVISTRPKPTEPTP